MRPDRRRRLALALVLPLLVILPASGEEDGNLPVRPEVLQGLSEVTRGVRNLVDPAWLRAGIGEGGRAGFAIDLTGVTRLLDGSEIEGTKIHGTVHAGPDLFESAETAFRYPRYRTGVRIREGRARLGLAGLLRPRGNSEGWTDRGTLALRFELYLAEEGPDRALGVYEIPLAFRVEDGAFRRAPTVVEGPFVSLVTSDDPTRLVVTFRTDEAIETAVQIEGGLRFESGSGLRHEIRLTGLTPGTSYRYRILAGPTRSPAFRLRTAPVAGSEEVVFAFLSDSREGVGGGDRTHMGHNRETLQRLTALAYERGAAFLLCGGDLVDGYTTSKRDFEIQLEGWKRTLVGYGSERPVYPAMGNHEALLRAYADAEGRRAALDRWPYATDSAEAVFADAFVNPANGPEPSDPRLPPYRENVYSFRYGPVALIAFNNNYWVSYQADATGGCPEGVILADQFAWLERELARAERDPTVRHVVLFAQEPVFPCGGHVGDAMWYGGNNRVRAFTVGGEDRKLRAISPGIVEVRNRFARLVASHGKVAAVLAGDEHCYHRVLIDRRTPVGIPAHDDRNGDGRIRWPAEACSPLADLAHPVWYLTSGGAGAPYYAEEATPWTVYWKQRAALGEPHPRGFVSSSQENLLIFRVDRHGISFEALNPFGERIDSGRL